MDPSGHNWQFIILETQGDFEGKSLTFLIDFGSSHSFISLTTMKQLQLDSHPTQKKLRVSLANGTSILEEEKFMDISFQLESHPTLKRFRVLRMGKFQGVLGWIG